MQPFATICTFFNCMYSMSDIVLVISTHQDKNVQLLIKWLKNAFVCGTELEFDSDSGSTSLEYFDSSDC